MNGFHFARVLPALALALVLPAWAIGATEQPKENAPAAVSDQANQASSSSDASASTQSDTESDLADTGKAQDKGSAGKQKPHGPTAIMDRATPKEKSDEGDASAKHPPTGRMDRTTPDQKSPASTSNDAQESSATK